MAEFIPYRSREVIEVKERKNGEFITRKGETIKKEILDHKWEKTQKFATGGVVPGPIYIRESGD